MSTPFISREHPFYEYTASELYALKHPLRLPPIIKVDVRRREASPQEIRSLKRRVAARRILRAWRNSREGLTMVRNKKEVLARLSHDDFQLAWEHIVQPKLKVGFQNPYRKTLVVQAVEELDTLRTATQKKKITPLCTGVNKGKAPDFQMVTEDRIPPACPHIGHFYLTPAARQQFISRPKLPLKKKSDLDAFVKTLPKPSMLIPWTYTEDGCYARANIIIDMLKLAGVHPKYLSKQFIGIPKSMRGSGPANAWTYHVAPKITLSDGSQWIIDPALDPNKAMSLTNWIDKQKRLPTVGERDVLLPNWGYLTLVENSEKEFPIPDSGFMITTSANTEFVYCERRKKTYFETSFERSNNDLEVMADYRNKAEKEWMREFLPYPAVSSAV